MALSDEVLFEAQAKLRVVMDDTDVGNDGERMVVANHWSYWAHLSIYRFALPFAAGRRVLDAGSGTGYGAAYLSRHGAAGVLALDAGADAIAHSRQRYAGDAVTYEVADLNAPLPVGDGLFGLVFSSNVFEHVGNVDGLAAECARVVAEDGVVVVAVPPVTSAAAMMADIGNHFHVNHIPPKAWHAKLSRFFTDVRYHAHLHVGEWQSPERALEEIALPPERVTIREIDFEFPEMGLETPHGPITAVFVCRGRRREPGPETLAERSPAAWREGEMAAQALMSSRTTVKQLQAELAQMRQDTGAPRANTENAWPGIAAGLDATVASAAAAQARANILAARVMALEASTSWRITAPLRAVVRRLRSAGLLQAEETEA